MIRLGSTTSCYCRWDTWLHRLWDTFPQGSAPLLTSFLTFLLYHPFHGSSTEKRSTPQMSCGLCGSSVGENAFPLPSAEEEGQSDRHCEHHPSAQRFRYCETRDAVQCGRLGTPLCEWPHHRQTAGGRA